LSDAPVQSFSDRLIPTVEHYRRTSRHCLLYGKVWRPIYSNVLSPNHL